MLAGGVHAVLVETAQDLLQAKAAIIGAKRALRAAGSDAPLMCQVTVETTGTMLLGSEIGAALTALEPLGIDVLGLNCATGPAEMSEHLRHLSRHARTILSCMPNAGLPVLGQDGAHYPLTPEQLAAAPRPLHQRLRPRPGRRLLRHHARAPAPGRREGPGTRARHPPSAPRGGRRLALPARAVPAGHVVPLHRRAHQRQRLAGLQEGDARGALGRLHRDRPRPDPRRRPPARRLHRLRRPRRCRGHEGDRRPVRHRLDAAAGARLHRAGRHRGGSRAARRPVGRQLGQLRGRRRSRVALRPCHAGRAGARRGRGRAVHRRGGPGAHRRVEGARRHPADRGPHDQLGHAGRGHRRRHV